MYEIVCLYFKKWSLKEFCNFVTLDSQWSTGESPPSAKMVAEGVLTLSAPKARKINGKGLKHVES